jgi:predicted RNA-binding Zn-ribbon protein involved in translation (DUF1610 family)
MEYVIYPCESCDKRIFAHRRHVGHSGLCPLCGEQTVIRFEAVRPRRRMRCDRRRFRRFELNRADVRVSKHETMVSLYDAGEAHPLHCLSMGGADFTMKGEEDPRLLCGFREPDIQEGEMLNLTLRVTHDMPWIRVRAVVKRIERERFKNAFRVACVFLKPPPMLKENLSRLLRRQDALGGRRMAV